MRRWTYEVEVFGARGECPVDWNEFTEMTEEDLDLGYTLDPEPLEDEGLDFAGDDEAYEPGLFARLTANRLLVIVLVIAFLLLVLSPWLYYLLNPPHPRPPREVPKQPLLRAAGDQQPAKDYSSFLGTPDGAKAQLTFLFRLDGVSKK